MVSKRVVAPQGIKGINSTAVRLAVAQYQTSQLSLRKCARLHNVPYSTLRRAAQPETASLKQIGRPPVFAEEEEAYIVNAVREFSNRGTPLSRDCLKSLIETFVKSLPATRQRAIPFKNGRPGDGYLRRFFARHLTLKLKRRSSLENARKVAMSPLNLATHFVRLKQVYKEFKITKAEQVFNIDESGFSTRTAARARSKAVFSCDARSNSTELRWASNAGHVTIMPVVSGDGRIWNPLAVLPGKQTKYRIRSDGSRETPASFLPPNAYCVYRETAGVDSEIFFQWTKKFLEETTTLRQKHRHIVLTMDSFGAHCSYRSLKNLKQGGVVVIGLPAHTSHRTQVLDYSVFSPFKTSFRNKLNVRSYNAEGKKNDIYTLCEMLSTCYYESVRPDNIISGFDACDVWNKGRGGADATVIKRTDITHFDGDDDQAAAFETYRDLVKAFLESRNLLRSDGSVMENGTLVTTTGALLTSEAVISALEGRARQRQEAQIQREARAAEAAARKVRRELEQAEKSRERMEEEVRKAQHLVWITEAPARAARLKRNRGERRAQARAAKRLREASLGIGSLGNQDTE